MVRGVPKSRAHLSLFQLALLALQGGPPLRCRSLRCGNTALAPEDLGSCSLLFCKLLRCVARRDIDRVVPSPRHTAPSTSAALSCPLASAGLLQFHSALA